MDATELNTPTVMVVTSGDVLADFGTFLRLHVADGDAPEHTIQSYYGNAAQYVAWCRDRGIDPAKAAERDLIAYRKCLIALCTRYRGRQTGSGQAVV